SGEERNGRNVEAGRCNRCPSRRAHVRAERRHHSSIRRRAANKRVLRANVRLSCVVTVHARCRARPVRRPNPNLLNPKNLSRTYGTKPTEPIEPFEPPEP